MIIFNCRGRWIENNLYFTKVQTARKMSRLWESFPMEMRFRMVYQSHKGWRWRSWLSNWYEWWKIGYVKISNPFVLANRSIFLMLNLYILDNDLHIFWYSPTEYLDGLCHNYGNINCWHYVSFPWSIRHWPLSGTFWYIRFINSSKDI